MASPDPKAADIIHRKKLQYCRFADSKQWKELDNIFLPDAKCSFYESDGSILSQGGVDFRFSSRDEMKSFAEKGMAESQSIHLVSAPELEQISPDEIKAVFCVMHFTGSKGAEDGQHGSGGGHYFDTWKRQGDDWFISEMEVRRLYFKLISS